MKKKGKKKLLEIIEYLMREEIKRKIKRNLWIDNVGD